MRQFKGPSALSSAMDSLLLRLTNLGRLFGMPFLLSQPCLLPIWTKLRPWAPAFLVRSNPLPLHNSHPAPPSIRIKSHSRLFRHAESTDLIPTSPHRLSPLFPSTGSRSRMSNCRQVSKGYLPLHLQNLTIDHLKSHSNLALVNILQGVETLMILSAANRTPFAKNGRSVHCQVALISGNLVEVLLGGLTKVLDSHHMWYSNHATRPKWVKNRFCLYGFMV